MRRKSAALLMVVGSVILSACTGRDSTSPRGIGPDQASYATSPGPATTCDFNAIKAAARTYFTSSQDPVFGMINDMSSAYKSGGAVGATPFGWTALGQVATERLTTSTTNGSDGAIFVIDVLRCMADLSTNPAIVPLDISAFTTSTATLVLNSGIFDIRTGGVHAIPAMGKVKAGGIRNFGSPGWGVETQTATSAWPGSITNATVTYLVYGYPETVGTPLLTSPTNINTNDDLTYPAPFNAFDLASLPTGVQRTGLRVGICYSTAASNDDGQENLLVHNNNQILATDSPTQMCDTHLQAAVQTAPAWYAMVLNRTLRLFTPAVAFAQTSDCFSCIGGLPSDWSPFGAGTLTAGSVALSVVTQPTNSFVGATNTVVVKAAFGTVAVPGVRIDSITVANNSGAPAGAIVTPINLPQTTDKDGLATATFSVGKAGGYLVTVYGSLDSQPVHQITTAQFQVQNK